MCIRDSSGPWQARLTPETRLWVSVDGADSGETGGSLNLNYRTNNSLPRKGTILVSSARQQVVDTIYLMQYGTTPLLEFKYIGKQYSSVSTIDSVAIDTNIPLSKKIYWTVVYDENSAAEPWADSVSYAQDFKYFRFRIADNKKFEPRTARFRLRFQDDWGEDHTTYFTAYQGIPGGTAETREMTFEELRRELEYSYRLGSRFVDLEGGEVMIWRDGDKRIDDVIDLAREVGFFSVTITTNAQLPFAGSHADSIWVSLDGCGKYHEMIRGEGTFARLERNIAACGHPHLSVNMVVNKYNWEHVAETIEYVKRNPAIESISINFYTPFPDADDLMITREQRERVIDTVIRMKRAGYPVMNSVSGLELMRHNRFKRRCWVTNFIYADHTRANCSGERLGICDDCGLCMAGEMNAVFNFRPDTIRAGLKLRL